MLSTNVLCIKKRKKRSYCINNRTEYAPADKSKRPSGGAAMFQITEDTPPDMLAGAMDLTVHLPTNRSVKMSVERSTPVMDLLVHITTTYQLQLSGYTLQILSAAPSNDHRDMQLPYKPNTPIGALDTQHIRVVPKARTIPAPKSVPTGHQPFESTFRLKVYLPRNQLYVTRVSQGVLLRDIMNKVCEEKNLDPLKYELRHPGDLDQVLDPKLTLSDYKITEIYIVLKGTGSLNQAFSTSDIMALRKEEERKQMHNKTGGGVFNLIFRRGKHSSGSVSSETRSISPTQSDDSRSVTPPGVPQAIIAPPQQEAEKPKPPQRKRRPAPKPPQVEETKKEPEAPKKIETGLTICHSRNSSDSSGYHEASILSDHCNTSLPRRPNSAITDEQKISEQYSQSTSNLSKMSAHSKSTSSLAVPARKKKSAPPPPPAVLKTAPSVTHLEEPSPVVASQPETIPESTTSLRTPIEIMASLPTFPQISTPTTKPDEETEPVSNVYEKSVDDNDVEIDWQYKLPDAPQGFRDPSPVPPPEKNNSQTEDVVDSVVTSPELFEKSAKENQSEKETVSDITSTVSEEEKPILNKLSLENLEKRKSLVYNRELATSLKMSEKEKSDDGFSNSLTKFEKTYEEVRRSSLKESVPKRSTLPNFKITTYDQPMQKLNIFEDDTVVSNVERSAKRHSLVEIINENGTNNLPFRKNSYDEDYKNASRFYKPPILGKTFNVSRSGSFSNDLNWTPTRPVTRSKSQVAINRYKDNRSVTTLNEDNLTKSNSLFDVSGLQSLGVMRLIQTKLNTPTTSTEELDKIDPEPKKEVHNDVKPEYHYQNRVPSINLGTWSDRPKIPVNVKEDPDYKFGMNYPNNNNTSKLIVKTNNNQIQSHNSFEIRNNFANSADNRGVTIKVNGSEPISAQNTGNVVIKIEESQPTFRKPFGDLNGADPHKNRPHSVAFGSDFDISRVPIVRSVEFKKPYKDFNKSVTQISLGTFRSSTLNRNGFEHSTTSSNQYRSTENLANKPTMEAKPAYTFMQNPNPVVRGFRNSADASTTTWNQPQSFATLPTKPKEYSTKPNDYSTKPKEYPTKPNEYSTKPKEYSTKPRDYSTNKAVPFSQSNLRRTESTKVDLNGTVKVPPQRNAVPPPAPAMPKTVVRKAQPAKARNCFEVEPRDELLQAIRNFGGKKGLRGVRA